MAAPMRQRRRNLHGFRTFCLHPTSVGRSCVGNTTGVESAPPSLLRRQELQIPAVPRVVDETAADVEAVGVGRRRLCIGPEAFELRDHAATGLIEAPGKKIEPMAHPERLGRDDLEVLRADGHGVTALPGVEREEYLPTVRRHVLHAVLDLEAGVDLDDVNLLERLLVGPQDPAAAMGRAVHCPHADVKDPVQRRDAVEKRRIALLGEEIEVRVVDHDATVLGRLVLARRDAVGDRAVDLAVTEADVARMKRNLHRLQPTPRREIELEERLALAHVDGVLADGHALDVPHRHPFAEVARRRLELRRLHRP